MKDEAMAWEYTRKEEERLAREDAIIAQWINREIADRFAEEITPRQEEIEKQVTLFANIHRAQIIADWESSQ